jgi:hypothetical protein
VIEYSKLSTTYVKHSYAELFGPSGLSQERRETALDADRSELPEVLERDHEGILSKGR